MYELPRHHTAPSLLALAKKSPEALRHRGVKSTKEVEETTGSPARSTLEQKLLRERLLRSQYKLLLLHCSN
jgi:hypothetical protein